MKIHGLEIDGYGVWTGLKVERLSDALSVFYGANEAGKTTLLQFIRSMLYGFSEQRRQYLPPVHGGTAGGKIDVSGPPGRFEVSRHLQDDSERTLLTAPDGTRQDEHVVKLLMSNIDEAIFNNVFAVELREFQELSTLDNTQAAELLYNLTAGLDRVSLVEVMRELAASRNRILDASGAASQITELWTQRETLRAEIHELGELTRRFDHLTAQRSQIETELARLDEEKNQSQRQLREAELATCVRERWLEREAIEDELAQLGPLPPMAEGEIERLEAINARLKKHRRRVWRLRKREKQLVLEAASLTINEPLRRQSTRIEALQEQEPWLASLKTRTGEMEAEIAEMENDLSSELQRLGLAEDSPGTALAGFSDRSFTALKSPAGASKSCCAKLKQSKIEQDEAAKTAESLAGQIGSALSARGEQDLSAAMDRCGNVVAQYRRRVQIDERLDQIALHRTDLEEQSRWLAEHQLLPVGVLAGLGAAFILGVVLILAGLFMPVSLIGSLGWAMALLGLAGSGAAVSGKYLVEKSRASRLASCQKQLAMLQTQQEQVKAEREQLDAQLPRANGPMVSRLQAAEADLAALEELVPLETQRNAARQQATAAGSRIAEAKQEFKSARKRWREALATANLPATMSVRQARRLSQNWRPLAESHRRLEQFREELGRRRDEWEMLAKRIAQVAAEAGVALDGPDAIEHLKQLAAALGSQQGEIERRETIRTRIRRLRLRRAKHEEAAARHKHRRRELFFQAGTEDEADFRRRALEHARAGDLIKRRNVLDADIAAVIGSQCSEAAVGSRIQKESPAGLESLAAAMKERLAAAEVQIRQRTEKLGELRANIERLVQDRQLPTKRLELAEIEKKLEIAADRWQVLATASMVLDRIRSSYESSRQPETLREASGYLERLTQGRYRRVWTPLGENALRVDDADGRSLPVENLSRGTREQLFLSLRMALAAGYARRGAALPLVLDDILVNFDADRAGAAAAVLRDFAAAGHQLLVFTCHQHISSIFASLGVPIGRLSSASSPALITFEIAEENKQHAEVDAKPARRPANRRKTASKIRASADEVESPPVPADRTIPIVEAEANRKPPPAAKPDAKRHAVFDADFFDSSDGKDAEAEDQKQGKESPASIDRRSIWEDGSEETYEYHQFNDTNSAEAA
jgi:uncharacterized protein YhaN